MIASARALPASIIGRASGIEHGTTSTPPAIMSCMPGAAPFDGTQGSAFGSMPCSFSRPAIARCQMPPWPVPEAFIFPGLALIAARRSLTDLYGESLRTLIAAGSTLKGCFSSFSSSTPMMRAVASVPPPAPHGTMSCTGRCGYCACAVAAAASSSAAISVLMALLLGDAGIVADEFGLRPRIPGSRIFLLEVCMNAPAEAAVAGLSLKDPKLLREQCYIDGRWVDADSRNTIAVHDPAT